MALPSSILRRGLRSAQPLATDVAAGTLYFVTDEDLTEQSNGSAWVTYSDASTGGIGGPGSSIDNAIVRWDGAGGDTLQDSAVTIADTTGVISGARFPNTGVAIRDTNASHDLLISPGSDLSADRTLSVVTGDANRTLSLPIKGVVGITIDGGGATITTGVKGYVRVPYSGTIISATLMADQTGSIVIDVWNDTLANFPPTDADSITSSAPPTISTATSSEDTTLTGWDPAIVAGDILGFNVDSVTSIQRVTLILEVNRT
jgi:hypothetical protein